MTDSTGRIRIRGQKQLPDSRLSFTAAQDWDIALTYCRCLKLSTNAGPGEEALLDGLRARFATIRLWIRLWCREHGLDDPHAVVCFIPTLLPSTIEWISRPLVSNLSTNFKYGTRPHREESSIEFHRRASDAVAGRPYRARRLLIECSAVPSPSVSHYRQSYIVCCRHRTPDIKE